MNAGPHKYVIQRGDHFRCGVCHAQWGGYASISFGPMPAECVDLLTRLRDAGQHDAADHIVSLRIEIADMQRTIHALTSKAEPEA